jgi:N-acetylglucosamine-6-phosphate deacetylase
MNGLHRQFSIRGLLSIDGELTEGAVVVSGDRISKVARVVRDEELPRPVYQADVISPGFIDLQVNGGFGVDADGDPDSYKTLARRLPESGVTSFLPTIISSSPDAYPSAFAALEQAKGAPGARALGFHLEGPFLAVARKGAHPASAIENATDALFDDLLASNQALLMTVAPERERGLERIARLHSAGVVVSLGHTDATAEEFEAGVDAGATMATHLYNAMSPFNHRAPGVIGAALADDRVVVGLIADGIHSHSIAITLALRAKGPRRIALVTDMMAAAGMPPGTYRLGAQHVTRDETAARLEDGTLAGSVLLMDEAVRNMVRWSGLSLGEVLPMATSTPARVLYRRDIGVIERDALADLVLLDTAGNVQKTFVGGELVYDRERVPA